MQALGVIEITAVIGLAQLDVLDQNIAYVSIADIPQPMRMPRIPAHVVEVKLAGLALTGPVTFDEGIRHLVLVGINSERPLHEWTFPASLVSLGLSECNFETIDLSGTTLRTVELLGQLPPAESILLPPTMTDLDISESDMTALPRLPPSIRYLGLMYCPELRDYSSLREVAIISLMADAPPSLYEYFPQLEFLSLIDTHDPLPEISLTHLKQLVISNCHVKEPIEVNTPNLERLVYAYTDQVTLRGCFLDTVTKLTLDEYDSFPEGDDWPSLQELNVLGQDDDERIMVEVPPLPFLKRMTLKRTVMTNGVEVRNLREYKAAWGVTGRAKGAQGGLERTRWSGKR